jgi:hypothetical protein
MKPRKTKEPLSKKTALTVRGSGDAEYKKSKIRTDTGFMTRKSQKIDNNY